MSDLLRVLSGGSGGVSGGLEPPPIWLMRQAGRYLPEYRELRSSSGSFLDFCYTPELAIEATLQPIRRYNFSAAIIFSDILVISDGLGQEVSFSDGEGPILEPLLSMSDLDSLDMGRLSLHLGSVYSAIRGVRERLSSDTALIGFAGGVWTLMVYAIIGRSPRDFGSLLSFCRSNSAFMSRLLDIFVDSVIVHLRNQIDSGVEVVQLFDSWASALVDYPDLYDVWVIEPHRRILGALRESHPDIPVICFPRGSGVLYGRFCEGLGDVWRFGALSLDQHISLSDSIDIIGCSGNSRLAVQGNLSPELLLGDDFSACRDAVLASRRVMRGKPYIFNLGHGVDKRTSPEMVQSLVDCVREAI